MTLTDLIISTNRAMGAIESSNLHPDIKDGLSNTITEYNDIIESTLKLLNKTEREINKSLQEYGALDKEKNSIFALHLEAGLVLRDFFAKNLSTILKIPYKYTKVTSDRFEKAKKAKE